MLLSAWLIIHSLVGRFATALKPNDDDDVVDVDVVDVVDVVSSSGMLKSLE